jgi:hypothetical protein
MTFPLDPGARAFQAKEAEPAEPPARPVPPECFQAEADEHADVMPPAPADAAADPSS